MLWLNPSHRREGGWSLTLSYQREAFALSSSNTAPNRELWSTSLGPKGSYPKIQDFQVHKSSSHCHMWGSYSSPTNGLTDHSRSISVKSLSFLGICYFIIRLGAQYSDFSSFQPQQIRTSSTVTKEASGFLPLVINYWLIILSFSLSFFKCFIHTQQ